LLRLEAGIARRFNYSFQTISSNFFDLESAGNARL
jgi:hypothetical protein